MNPIEMPQDVLESITKDRKVRRALARDSHGMFFGIYLPHYVKYETAPCQREFFRITEDETSKLNVVVAFRGSGKSTIITLSYPIWAIIGRPQKKFILILSQTQSQAKQHLINIKRELEQNSLLRGELGPFEQLDDEWGSQTLVIPKHGARITAASTETSIRGIRHGEHRPDLIICDDVEDTASVKTRESRDKTFNWLTGEIQPAGEPDTKTVIVGNLLHEDSLVMRLKERIEAEQMTGQFRAFPLVTPDDKSAWPGQFPNAKAIEAFRKRIGNEVAWQREYLLNIVPDENQLILHEWIKHYDRIDESGKGYRGTFIGVDLAISQRDTADYTTMVAAHVYGYSEDMRIYILPHPINKRLTHLETINQAKRMAKQFQDDGRKPKFYVEEVGYQGAAVETLLSAAIPVEGVKVGGSDKRARLGAVSHLVQAGKVMFPKVGAEMLISQLTGFGTEKHDDLADAFAIVLHKAITEKPPGRMIIMRHSMLERTLRHRGFGNLLDREF